MNSNLNNILAIFLIIFYFLIPSLDIQYQPTQHQISTFLISLIILLTSIKSSNIENNEILIKVIRKKYLVIYFAIYIQLLLMIWDFGMGAWPVELLAGVFGLGGALYVTFK